MIVPIRDGRGSDGMGFRLSTIKFLAALVAAAPCFLDGVSTARGQERIMSPAEHCKTALWGKLDEAWKWRARKIVAQMQRSTGEMADYERLKKELRDSVLYLGLFDATEKWVLVAGEVAQSIKTTANLFNDMLDLTPTGYLKSWPAKLGRKYFYQGLKIARNAQELDAFIKDSAQKGTLYSAGRLATKLNPVLRETPRPVILKRHVYRHRRPCQQPRNTAHRTQQIQCL